MDQQGTSKEALEALLGLDIGTSIYYTFSPIIFHPKIYLFEGDEKCRIIVGSSNLTKTGLFQNIEISLRVDFIKPDKNGEELLKQMYDYFESFFDDEVKNLHKLTQEIIEKMSEGGIIPDEFERMKVWGDKKFLKKETGKVNKLGELKSLFPTVRIQKLPSSLKTTTVIKREKKKVTVPPLVEAVTATPSQDVWGLKGRLVWKKTILPQSDVLYAKSGTNPTGGLRLTQAGWKVGGKGIDWTTYFRQDLFGNFTWDVKRTTPFVEVAKVLFNVKILGKDIGQHQLVLRHKPIGEAGQRNYTTLLSWGEIGEEIKKTDLRGKDLYLYAPPAGQNEPFYIDIK
ncbi:MAG: phospholipase D family protein [Nanoarchaeota archaeon]|nr:phospholipase D family protein [Nanoarchaeota archaeon]